jgi:excisionase family DNA binding protein
MADKLQTIDEVCKELQLTSEQVVALVKSGVLRGFLDGNTYKFRPGDVDKYKATAESGATIVIDDASDASGASATKIDLGEIESEIDADISDQTSVLAPVDAKDDSSKAEDEAVFEFSEDELGLSIDSDSSSPADSVLVADESESSMDILEIADESSSTDSATSTADFDFMDESSSSEEVAEVADIEDMTPEPVQFDLEGGDTVSDILASSEEEMSDEELDTLDLDDVVETQDTILEEPETVDLEEDIGVLGDDISIEEPATGTAETVPVGDESETVGIAHDDATQAVDLDADSSLDLGGAEADLEEASPFEPSHVATGYDLETPSIMGNAFLAAAILITVIGGAFVLTSAANAGNPLMDFFRSNVLSSVEGILKSIAGAS